MKKILISLLLCICLLSCSKQIYLPETNPYDRIEEISYITFQELGIDIDILVESVIINHKYDFPYYFIYSIIEAESEFKITAKSKNNCKGLMQLSDIVINEYNIENKTNILNAYNIENNMEIGFWYLNKLRKLPKIENYYDLYIAYNVGYSYFKRNKKDLYNGKYKNHKYNALDRFKRFEQKYKEKLNEN